MFRHKSYIRIVCAMLFTWVVMWVLSLSCEIFGETSTFIVYFGLAMSIMVWYCYRVHKRNQQ